MPRMRQAHCILKQCTKRAPEPPCPETAILSGRGSIEEAIGMSTLRCSPVSAQLKMAPNPSINTDWLTAGFARFQPAGYVRR
jgi:hypothetical protein